MNLIRLFLLVALLVGFTGAVRNNSEAQQQQQDLSPYFKDTNSCFVGYVETGGDTYFFATNIEGPTYASIRDKRIELTKQILSGMGVLPKG
jgi:beta-lactamase class D